MDVKEVVAQLNREIQEAHLKDTERQAHESELRTINEEIMVLEYVLTQEDLHEIVYGFYVAGDIDKAYKTINGDLGVKNAAKLKKVQVTVRLPLLQKLTELKELRKNIIERQKGNVKSFTV